MFLEVYWCSVMYVLLMVMLFGGIGLIFCVKYWFGKKIIIVNVFRRCRLESEIGGILFWIVDVMFECKGYLIEYIVIIKFCVFIVFCL